jgi:DNA helicase HerA-like ATPase
MSLPFPEAILHQHSATLGKTGAGKSSVLRDMVEDRLDKKKRTCIVDPKGDWWGLKVSADGKSAGYPVITFGNFKNDKASDVPINEHSGAQIAELIASGNRPCVIGFRGWMPGQMVKFWLDFLPTLFNKNEGELYVFVDEMQNFAPKGKIQDPQAGMCVHWTNKAMSESRGLGMTFHIASQRSQKVHNDTLDCCETLIAMRTAHPAARKSIEDWINSNGDPAFAKEVLTTMAELKKGEAWVWSPENGFGPKRVQFPMFRNSKRK